MAASVQSMCQYWKNFNLQELQKELDTTATDLANRQDESDASRKRLVEQSREFKKKTPEDIRKIVAPLLKSFQAEVDNLSKRSKAAEGAILSVYKKLIDLPDPVEALDHALAIQKKAQRVQDLEIENKQLRDTLTEYNHEFAEVKNQEVTIKSLKDKLRSYEEKLESTAEARAKEKQRELQRYFSDKERQLQETQLDVARKLGESEHRVASLEKELEAAQSELFEVKNKYDEATTAKADEMEIIMADLDRANERTSTCEREMELLKKRLSATSPSEHSAQQSETLQHHAPDMDRVIRSNLELELSAKEKQISQLVDDIQKLQASMKKQQEMAVVQIANLEEELAVKTRALARLEEMLRTQEDYHELKRELDVLKSIEFSGLNDEARNAKSLEVLLLEKNKSLQSENTQLKVSNTELNGDYDESIAEAKPTVDASPTSSINSDFDNKEASSDEILLKTSEPCSTDDVDHCASPPSVKIESDTSEIVSPKHCSKTARRSFNGHMTAVENGVYPGYQHDIISRLGTMEVHKNGMFALDTMLVACTVRELLSIHNLGQRLFAKYVLGLSQGTVSELLSKPKMWEKLTEKGRESYRKMYLWALDERNIDTLKAFSPKKGTQPLVATTKHNDSATEEKIAHILNEAHMAMQVKRDQQEHWKESMSNNNNNNFITKDSNIEPHTEKEYPRKRHKSGRLHDGYYQKQTSGKYSRSKSPQSLAAYSHRRQTERDVNESAEMVSRIYRQELLKLAEAAEKAGNLTAYSAYQQELTRVSQSSPPYIRRSVDARVKSEPPDSTTDELPQDLSKHSSLSVYDMPQDLSKPRCRSSSSDYSNENLAGSAFSPFYPQRLNGQAAADLSDIYNAVSTSALSPLQRMQSIANSVLISSGHNPLMTKPLRCVLPPISQEQFDAYPNIDTEEIVCRVKETLSQYSISQRLFGEHVLGLSQGSVSDLLARPKSWHMLTQKGREPFIRMQLFLQNAESMANLVNNPYHHTSSPDNMTRSLSTSLSTQTTTTNSTTGTHHPPHSPSNAPITHSNDATKALQPQVNHAPYIAHDAHPSPPITTATTTALPDTISRPSIYSPVKLIHDSRDLPTYHTPTSVPIPPPLLSHIPCPAPQSSISNNLAPLSNFSNLMFPPHDNLTPTPNLPRNIPPIPTYSVNPSFSHSHPMLPSVPINRLPSPAPPSHIPPMLPPQQTNPHIAKSTHKSTSKRKAKRRPGSLYDIAAVTAELDTTDITAKVKDVLQLNNLGQKLFGKVVLGLSQGSVSELLSKPKPWSMLSVKGREPFIRMNMWLSDPYNIDRLKYFNSEVKVTKRHKVNLDENVEPAPKRPRVYFTEEQKDALRSMYKRDPYPNPSSIEAIAYQLGIGVRTVVNWFHNHRMRAKHLPETDATNLVKREVCGDSIGSHSDASSAPGTPANADTSHGQPADSQWLFPVFTPAHKPTAGNDTKQELSDGGGGGGGDAFSQTTAQSGVKKRKSSNPKWVCQGRQLDKTQLVNQFVETNGNESRTIDHDDSNPDLSSIKSEASFTKSPDARREDIIVNGKESDDLDDCIEADDEDNDDDDNDDDIDMSVDLRSEINSRIENIKRLQRAINASDESWDEVDRSSVISKLQSNIGSSQDDAWEF